ncbi:MAG: FAD-dependent monooxygenase [Actinomycetota bacterium]
MRVAIVGAGIGGLTLAALLDRDGHEVVLVEQARVLGEVGAGIQVSPNATRVLHHLGLAEPLERVGTTPERVVLRRWEDDRELLSAPFGSLPQQRYGFAHYNVYRPDLIELLAGAVGGVETRFASRVERARNLHAGAALDLADGSTIEADVVVGADGIHSVVRGSVFDASPSRFSKSVAYRALIPRRLVSDLPIEVTSRFGPEKHLVTYFVGESQRFLNLVCVVPEERWDVEGWNEPGSLTELRSQFASWSPELNAILDQVSEPIFRWALHDRLPMQNWVNGHIALLGDSCHAMLPFMAQGACQAIEDGAILSRLLSTGADVPASLGRYQGIRSPRAVRLQERSWRNASSYHLPDGPEQRVRDELYASVDPNDSRDPFAWLYDYDALGVELD